MKSPALIKMLLFLLTASGAEHLDLERSLWLPQEHAQISINVEAKAFVIV